MGEPLDGFEAMEAPRTPVKSRIGQVVMAFLESGNECMGRRYDDPAELKRDANAAYQWLSYKRNRSLGVRASRRGDMLLLIREKVGK